MFPLTITKVDEVLFDGEVTSVTCPGKAGELTILARHSALITTLKEGTIRVKENPDSVGQEFEVTGGLLEVGGNKAVVLL